MTLVALTNYSQDNSSKSSSVNAHVSRRSSGNSNPKNANIGYKVTFNRVLRGLEEEKEGNCTLQETEWVQILNIYVKWN